MKNFWNGFEKTSAGLSNVLYAPKSMKAIAGIAKNVVKPVTEVAKKPFVHGGYAMNLIRESKNMVR